MTTARPQPPPLSTETLALACRAAELYTFERVIDVERYAFGARLVLRVRCDATPAVEFEAPITAPDPDAAIRASVATFARGIAEWRLALLASSDESSGSGRALLRISDGEIRP